MHHLAGLDAAQVAPLLDAAPQVAVGEDAEHAAVGIGDRRRAQALGAHLAHHVGEAGLGGVSRISQVLAGALAEAVPVWLRLDVFRDDLLPAAERFAVDEANLEVEIALGDGVEDMRHELGVGAGVRVQRELQRAVHDVGAQSAAECRALAEVRPVDCADPALVHDKVR